MLLGTGERIDQFAWRCSYRHLSVETLLYLSRCINMIGEEDDSIGRRTEAMIAHRADGVALALTRSFPVNASPLPCELQDLVHYLDAVPGINDSGLAHRPRP